MKSTMWILVIVIVLLAGVGIYLLNQGKGNMTPSPSQLPNPNSNPTSSPSSTPTPTPAPTHSDLMGNIANNHGHTVVITVAQQEAGQAVRLGVENVGLLRLAGGDGIFDCSTSSGYSKWKDCISNILN